MKLFTIGDSVSQGFMSGAAARTDRCFSTLIAHAMGLTPTSSAGDNSNPTIYYYPEWKMGGLPANLEVLLRKLNQRYGHNIRGLEWVTFLNAINEVIDASEDYYERGEGREDQKYHGNVPFFHNISLWTCNVADAWLLTPQICKDTIERLRPVSGGDGYLTAANASFFRTALKVLEPNLDHSNRSQLDWLQFHAGGEGIDNLILWMGMNNTIGTIVSFKIMQTPNDPDPAKRPHLMNFEERCKKNWNLWHPADFKAEYEALLDKVDNTMSGGKGNQNKDWKVFIATIPCITISPFIKGVGPKTRFGEKGIYYKYYTYMLFDEVYARQTGKCLTVHEALHIDDCIRAYNHAIGELVKRKNEAHSRKYNRKPYHIVDICDALNRMAWKRNDGMPPYQFPEYFQFVYPPLNTKYYYADQEKGLWQGGIFSLDGVHPSIIGQGLIAHEFMQVMKAAGVGFKNELDWPEIFKNDALYQQPITLMGELYEHRKLADIFISKVLALAREIRQGA